MSEGLQVAIVDYGMGNLFSVKQACAQAGLRADVTSVKRDILAASAVILPGVGAFGTAMESLAKLDLVEPLKDVAASERPFVGICLGMQLLMTESHEFGRHRGLGLIEGEVVPLPPMTNDGCRFKVPQVGWNHVHAAGDGSSWKSTLLDGLVDDEFMYFVHSFYCKPADPGLVLTTTRYGLEFCSSLRRRNIFACQFHPERSARQGLQIYRNLSAAVRTYLSKEACSQ